MSINIILLDNEENFIRYLNPEEISVTEHEETGKISSLKLKIPLSEDIIGDINDFTPGHKIWISGSQVSRDCLYLINESLDTNIWVKQEIELNVEEVLTELNYAPLLTPFDLANVWKGDVVEKSVPVDVPHLKQWFGQWFQIDANKGYEAPEQLNIQIPETMTRMEFLRYIEQETHNIFRTRYVKKPDENIIVRYLDFKRPHSFGKNKHEVVTINYNADNIIYSVDESKSFTAISPLIKVKRKEELEKWKQTNTAIKKFKDIKIKKGEKIPYGFSSTYNEMYPIPSVKVGKKAVVEGTSAYGKYFRRIPGDYWYVDFPTLFWTDGYLGGKHNSKTIRKIEDIATKKNIKKYDGYICKCAEDGDYTLWRNNKSYKATGVKEGDYFICNGYKWEVVRKKHRTERLKWITALSFWKAPFNKRAGEFYITNDKVDSKINYDHIYSRPNPDSYLEIGGVDEYIEDPIEEASEKELDDDDTGDDGEQPFRILTPKIGNVKPTETNYDPYEIYRDVVKELRKVNHPFIKVKANIKDLKLTGNYNLYDKVYVKIPTINHLVETVITKTDKNPQLIGDVKIELENSDVFKPIYLKKPLFRIRNETVEPNASFEFKGRLVTTVTTTGKKPRNVDVGVPNRRVYVAIIKPNSKKTIQTKNINLSGGKHQKGKFDKYGRSPDKTFICGIGYKSAGKDNQFWKGVFKNRCPRCGRRGGLYWGFKRRNTYNPISKRNWSLRKWGHHEGEFTCGYCGADYSVQGWEKRNGSRYRLKPVSKGTVKKYANQRLGKKEANQLIKGKLKFKEVEDTAKTTTKTKNIPGNCWVYSAVTDKNGWFKIKTKLKGIEKKNYKFQCTFAGDNVYDDCTGTVEITCREDPKWNINYKVTGNAYTGKTMYIPRRGCSHHTGKLSKSVEKKAKQIVGTKKGLAAVKLLANWVSKHIKYKYRNNFKHSPASTLRTRRGNCCEKADLFMHMCEACNLHRKQGGATSFKLQYVHTRKGKDGHVFIRIGRGGGKYTYIDPTVGGGNCYGKVVRGYKPTKRNKKRARISTYPCLPFGRDYR